METIKHNSGRDLSIRANDILISYNDLGKGDQPIIFVHGFPFNKTSWQPQLDVLSVNYRTIAYDIRGFGKSQPGAPAFSISLFADDLVNFMDALKIDQAIVCGLSMGGYIAMNAIGKYPDRFSAIVLCDTQCIADSQEAKKSRYATVDKIENGGFTEFADGFLGKLFSKETNENNKDLVNEIRKVIITTQVSSVTGTLKALAERDATCNILDSVNIPALILCGNEDVITPVEQSEAMNKKLSHSVMHTINNAGHLSNLEQPVEFNKFLLQFLAKLK